MYVSINPEYTQQEIKRVNPSKEYLDFILKGALAFKLGELMKKCGALYNTATDHRAFS
jgi:hypothetical protein